MADQVENLVVTTKGAEELANLAKRAREVDAAISELKGAFSRGIVVNDVYQKELAKLERQQASLAKQTETLTGSKGGGGFKGMSGGALQASYALQDLVAQNGDLLRGFMAIQNNVPGLVMSLGGSMGVAGAIGAVSLAASLAAPHVGKFIETLTTGIKPEWRDEFMRSLKADDIKNFTDELDRLRTRIEEIEKKPLKLAIDYTELKAARDQAEQLESGLKAFDEWKKQHTDKEKESGAAVAKIMGNAPANIGDVLFKQEFRALQDANGPVLKELAERIEAAKNKIRAANQLPQGSAEGDVLFSQGQKELRAAMALRDPLMARLEREARANVGTMREGAEKGDRGAREALVKRLNEAAQDRLAERIGGVSPEALRAAELEQHNLEQEAKAGYAANEARLARKEFPTAAREFDKLSPKRRAAFMRGGESEADAIRRYGEEYSRRVADEAAHPEPPKTIGEEQRRREQAYQDKLDRMTPMERQEFDRRNNQKLANERSAPTIRSQLEMGTPEAKAREQQQIDTMKAQQPINPALEAAQGYIGQVQAENAMLRAQMQQMGAMFRQAQVNQRAMQGPLQSNDFSYFPGQF